MERVQIKTTTLAKPSEKLSKTECGRAGSPDPDTNTDSQLPLCCPRCLAGNLSGPRSPVRCHQPQVVAEISYSLKPSPCVALALCQASSSLPGGADTDPLPHQQRPHRARPKPRRRLPAVRPRQRGPQMQRAWQAPQAFTPATHCDAGEGHRGSGVRKPDGNEEEPAAQGAPPPPRALCVTNHSSQCQDPTAWGTGSEADWERRGH